MSIHDDSNKLIANAFDSERKERNFQISMAYERGYHDRLNDEHICPYGFDTMPEANNLWWAGYDEAYSDSRNDTMQFDCERLACHRPKYRFAVCIYHEDGLAYGGPEEGGWWYETGTLERVVKVTKSEKLAHKLCQRLNARLGHLADVNGVRHVSSSIYAGGRYHASVENVEEKKGFHVLGYYPEIRPHYE